MKLYISGPMRGLPDNNRAAFEKAARKLEETGHSVYSPHEMEGKDHEETVAPKQRLRIYAKRDVAAILECHGIVLLDNWTQSLGVIAELMLARWMEMPVYTIDGIDIPGPAVLIEEENWMDIWVRRNYMGAIYRDPIYAKEL